MKVELTKKNNLIYINYLGINHIINLDYLNLIYFWHDKYIISDIDDEKMKEYLYKSEYLLIIGYDYKDFEKIDILKKELKLNLIDYSSINLYYITGFNIKCKYVEFENIYYDFEILSFDCNKTIKNNEFDININNSDINNIKNIITNIGLEINNFIDNVKTYSITELDNKHTDLYIKFNKLDELLENVTGKYEIIKKELESKEKELNNLVINNNIDENIDFNEKREYLLKLLNIIKTVEQNKKHKLERLEYIEEEIQKKNSKIQNLESKLLKINDLSPKVAILCHIYKIEVWYDIIRYIKNFKDANYDFDLYVNIAANDINTIKGLKYQKLKNELENLKLYNNLYITYSDNRGMDIGGFMISYIKLLEMNKKYDIIIKIHSKTNDNWRFALLYSLLGNKTIIDNNFNLMKDQNIGMLGNQIISLLSVVNKKSYRYIDTYMERFNVKLYKTGHFIPGTIFMIKNKILKNYFTKELLLKCYNEFAQDYCGNKKNIKEGKPHAFERFFGMFVDNSGYKTVRFDTNL